MNYATKLRMITMVSLLGVSSIGLVQAADTPIVSTGGVAYNIGIPGDSKFTYSDNVSLGGQAGTTNGNSYLKPGDPNATGNNIAIGRISLNGSSGGGNVALGGKTFLGKVTIISSVILRQVSNLPYPIQLLLELSLAPMLQVIKTCGLAMDKALVVMATILC